MNTENTEEKWEIVNNFPNYKISNLGRVKNIKTEKILKTHILNSGYYSCSLYNKNLTKKGRKCKDFTIHRLVGIHFIKNEKPEEYIEIDHMDNNKLNNHYSNLKWVSRSINEVYKNKRNRKKMKKKGSIFKKTLKSGLVRWNFQFRIKMKIKTITFDTKKECEAAQLIYLKLYPIIEEGFTFN